MDIGDEAAVAAGVNAGTAHFGSRLDILFNNAALTDQKTQSQDADVTTTPVDVWTQTLQVNTTGYMLCCSYAIPLMVRNGGGCIINTASGAAMLADLARVAYGVSKAGVIALTKYMSPQPGKQRIRFTPIPPSATLTAPSR